MKEVAFIQYMSSIFIANDGEGVHEMISLYPDGSASISLQKNEGTPFSFYIEKGFKSCLREEYLIARYKAQTALAEFFGEQSTYAKPAPLRYNRFRDEE